MTEFHSDPITPVGGHFDTAAMGRGEPGLPEAFSWRDETCRILQVLERWKVSSAEGSRAGADVYLRRHYYRLQMSDQAIWTVYFVRQTPRSGSPKARWFLYTRQT